MMIKYRSDEISYDDMKAGIQKETDNLHKRYTEKTGFHSIVDDKFNTDLSLSNSEYSLKVNDVLNQERMNKMKTIDVKQQEEVIELASKSDHVTAITGINVRIADMNTPKFILQQGGSLNAEKAKREFIDTSLSLQIMKQINENPSAAEKDLLKRGDDDPYQVRDDESIRFISPDKRFILLTKARNARIQQDKKIKDKIESASILQHVANTGIIPVSDTKYKKLVNEEYAEFSHKVKDLPLSERYAKTRDYVTKRQMIPDVLKHELISTFNSKNPEEVKSALLFTNDFIRQNPKHAKDLSESMVTSSIMLEAGMSIEDIIDINQKNRKLSVSEREGLDQLWDSKETKENITNSLEDVIDDYDVDESNHVFMAEYKRIYKQHFYTSNGNPEAATKLTNLSMKNTWGKTEIDGNERLMKYAPESMIREGNKGNWMGDQLQQDVLKNTGIDLSEVPYRLIPSIETIKGSKKPIYHVEVEDEHGRINVLINPETNRPIKWTPDYSQTHEYKEELEVQQERAIDQKEREINALIDKNYQIQYEQYRTQKEMQKRALRIRAIDKELIELVSDDIPEHKKIYRDKLVKERERLTSSPKHPGHVTLPRDKEIYLEEDDMTEKKN